MQALNRRNFSKRLAGIVAGLSLGPAFGEEADKRQATFKKRLAELEKQSGGKLGVAIRDFATGAVIDWNADQRFPMCSTFKVLACSAILAKVDRHEESLERRIVFRSEDLVEYSPVTKEKVGGEGMTLGEICEAAMTQSDNTAANLILASLGGPQAVTAFARSIGDETSRLDRTETSLNEALPGDPRDTTSPAAMAADLQALALGDKLSAASREQLIKWMTACKTGDARLRAGLPKGWNVADKTGSGERGTANDVAILSQTDRKPIIACVYLTGGPEAMEQRNAIIAAVGKALADL